MIHASRRLLCWSSLVVLSLVLAAPRRAQAQASDFVDRGRLYSNGLLLPPTSAATEQSPWALSLNPAGLLFNPTGLGYIHEDGTTALPNARRGDGLFLRLGGLSAGDAMGVAAGASIEYLRPAGGGCPRGSPCLGRFSLGIAGGTPAFSFGLAYHWYNSDESRAVDRLGTLDAGLTWRPARWLSAAATVSALNSPTFIDGSLGRVFTLAAAVRPFCRGFTLAADYLVDDRAGWRGSRLAYLAQFSLPRGVDLYGQLAHEVEAPPEGRHLALQVGLSGSFGVGAAYLSEASVIHNGSGGVAGTVAVELWRGRAEAIKKPTPAAQVLDIQEELSGPGTLSLLLGLSNGLDAYTKLALRFEQLARDESLDTLVIEVRGLKGMSLGRVEELRTQIRAMRAAGKKVLVWLEEAGDTEYYFATAADKIYAAPQAMLQVNGFSTERIYFRGLLDRLGIVPEFVKIGAYKSAPESYTETHASGPSAEETNALLDDQFGRYVAAVSASRHLTVDQVREKIARGLFVSEEAMDAGLIDGVSSDGPALEDAVFKLAGHPLVMEGFGPRRQLAREWGNVPVIAIVEVVGDIVPSSLSALNKSAAAGPIVRELRAAAADPNVRAIVLRVDSPGGDVGASELIYQAVSEARLRKPVIASFGDVAASGGYYIASAASQIIAEPSTITGSIGVFAGKADLSKLLDSIGITTQTFKRGEHADLFTLTRPWTPEERHVVEGMVSTFYEAFVKRVAIGRKMTVEQVKAVAEGRVWTGAQAKDKGLVDSLGGLEEALKEARREAGLPSNAHVAVTGARGLFDLPDASATVAALQGRSRVDAPSALIALHDLFAGTAQGRSIDEAWPLLQALMEGRPLALALDVPIAR